MPGGEASRKASGQRDQPASAPVDSSRHRLDRQGRGLRKPFTSGASPGVTIRCQWLAAIVLQMTIAQADNDASPPEEPHEQGLQRLQLVAVLDVDLGKDGLVPQSIAMLLIVDALFWLEIGPADTIAQHLTFTQLHAEWNHLQLTDLLRDTWEGCFPELGADIRQAHPAATTPAA